MNAPDPPRPSTAANVGQRLFSLFVLVVVAALIWLAYSGRYDREVNHLAAWLHHLWDALRR